MIGDLGLPETSYPTTAALPEPFTKGCVSIDSVPAPAAPCAEQPWDVTLSNPAFPFSTVPETTCYAEQPATGACLAPEAARLQAWAPLTSTGVRLQYGQGIRPGLGRPRRSILGYSDAGSHLPEGQASVVVMIDT